MADWYGSARSNYFRVKDVPKFVEFCKRWGIEPIYQKDGGKNPVGFLCDKYGDGSLPAGFTDTIDGKEVDLTFGDFLDELSQHLAYGSVAVMMECGAEKLRYITGQAVAINSRGETRVISLNDIYKKARKLGSEEVSLCEY
jgi:hypothetical protein